MTTVKFNNLDSETTPSGASFVARCVHRASYQLARRTIEILDELDQLTLAEWRIATALNDRGQLNQRSLVEFTRIEQAQVSRSLARMEDRGLIVSAQDSEDKRARIFRLTGKGRAAFTVCEKPMVAFSENIDAQLSPAEVRQLIRLLRKVTRVVDERPPVDAGPRD